MNMITNPIIPGMAPDPSIIRSGGDYYIATSTFHWAPGVIIYHSHDLVNWQQYTTVLQNGEIDLRGTNTPAGIWAPHLSYDESEKKFWLVYSLMENMAGREFNAQSYAMWAKDIIGPWSEPIYLTSIGFDPSLYHENGRHYLTILEWETRSGYQAPGHLSLAEIDLSTGKLINKWNRITTGFTTRGCIEAPQIYKHNGYYYLLAASGGTGYAHGIEMGRAKDIFGPYEGNPTGEPILTASPRHLFSLGDPDAGHFEMFNPHSPLQKAGHGSLVETPDHEWYITHLMSRPLPGTKLNPLGRETGLQKVRWTKEGWLELEDGSNLAKLEVPAPKGAANIEQDFHLNDIFTDFSTNEALSAFFTPYHPKNESWANIKNGHLELYGDNSLFSQVKPSILATRATSFKYSLQTKLSFSPDHYSERAGAGLYYDSNNWLYAYIALNDKEERLVLCLMQAKLGERITYDFDAIPLSDSIIELRLDYDYGIVNVFYRQNGAAPWRQLSDSIDATYLSDEGVNGEPGEIGGFTGLFNFIGAVDAHQHDSHGDYFYYQVTSTD